MIKTAGKILNEHDIYTYVKCSEMWHNNGQLEERDPLYRICRHALDQVLSKKLYGMDRLSLNAIIAGAINQSMKVLKMHGKYLDAQLLEWHGKAMIWIASIFDILSLDEYFLVSGPIPWRVIVNKTAVDINISAIFRTKKNKTLHVLYCSPYKSEHDCSKDPVAPLLTKSLKTLLPRQGSGNRYTDVRLHVVNYKDSVNSLRYHIVDEVDSSTDTIKSIIAAMEAGLHWPVLPCAYNNCAVRHLCGVKNGT